MSVQRVPSVPFAQIANEALRDKRLSFKARGVLAMVMSHSGEWNATARWLESQSDKDGREAIQSALNELNELGYREVLKERGKDGEIRTVVVWRQIPEMRISRPTVNPTDGKPDQRLTRGSIEHNSSEHYLEEHNLKKEHDPAPKPDIVINPPVPISNDFDLFWAAYPRRAGKSQARLAWKKAAKTVDARVIIAAAERFALDPNREDQYTPHPTTWLNQGRWDDDPLPAKGSKFHDTMTEIYAATQREGNLFQ
jgi:hypothetical protein